MRYVNDNKIIINNLIVVDLLLHDVLCILLQLMFSFRAFSVTLIRLKIKINLISIINKRPRDHPFLSYPRASNSHICSARTLHRGFTVYRINFTIHGASLGNAKRPDKCPYGDRESA